MRPGRRWSSAATLLAAAGLVACGGGSPGAAGSVGSSTPTASFPGASGTVLPTPTSDASPPSSSSPRPSSPRPSSPRPSVSPTPAPSGLPVGLLGRVVPRVPTSSHVVALTFDAGANADGVSSILATLSAKHVPASFFLTGRFVTLYPGPSRQLAAAGRVGNHTVTHPHLPDLAAAQARAEVTEARATILVTTGEDPLPFFRFPYGSSTPATVRLVNGLGYVAVGWTVDSLGWKGTSGSVTVDSVISRVVGARTPGAIVLMHVGSNPTDGSTLDADALPQIIDGLRAQGYSFVTLDALLG
ncbi:MAG TPA: polysaccharide deacetylase family protein [Candidatus Limnocylindria bacterium]|nr:polysaccharide deacetylase family protein [Candidatus Limnocylindria bacterium]